MKKTNILLVLGCLLFVLALGAITEAARSDYDDRRSGGDYGGGGRGGGGRGGYDDYEDQGYGGGRPNYPAKIEPEVTKVVKKCGEDSLKVKFQWDFFIFLKIVPPAFTQLGLSQASMAV